MITLEELIALAEKHGVPVYEAEDFDSLVAQVAITLGELERELAALRDQRWHEYAQAAMGGEAARNTWSPSAALAVFAATRADAMMKLIAQRAGEGQG